MKRTLHKCKMRRLHSLMIYDLLHFFLFVLFLVNFLKRLYANPVCIATFRSSLSIALCVCVTLSAFSFVNVDWYRRPYRAINSHRWAWTMRSRYFCWKTKANLLVSNRVKRWAPKSERNAKKICANCWTSPTPSLMRRCVTLRWGNTLSILIPRSPSSPSPLFPSHLPTPKHTTIHQMDEKNASNLLAATPTPIFPLPIKCVQFSFLSMLWYLSRYGSPHHCRSQSVKAPGRGSGRPNQLSLPQQRSR